MIHTYRLPCCWKIYNTFLIQKNNLIVLCWSYQFNILFWIYLRFRYVVYIRFNCLQTNSRSFKSVNRFSTLFSATLFNLFLFLLTFLGCPNHTVRFRFMLENMSRTQNLIQSLLKLLDLPHRARLYCLRRFSNSYDRFFLLRESRQIFRIVDRIVNCFLATFFFLFFCTFYL